MNIKTKLTYGIGLLFVLITLLGGLAIKNIHNVSDDTQNILADNYNSLLYSRQMLESLDAIRENPNARKNFEAGLEAQRNNLTEKDEDVLTNRLSSYCEKALDDMDDESIRQIRQTIYTIMAVNMSAIYEKNEVAVHTAKRSLFGIWTVGIACITIAFLFLVRLPRSVSVQIRKLTDGIKEITNANYSKRLDLGNEPEFKEIATLFNEMAERLAEYRNSSLEDILQGKKYIETIINSIAEPIIGLSKERKILFVNDEALTVLNLTRENIIGRPAPEVALKNDLLRRLIRQLVHPDDNKDPLKIYADNKESYFQVKYIPINVNKQTGLESKYVGDVILLKNVTEFKEKDIAKTTFISTISHELKTPISAIMMSLTISLHWTSRRHRQKRPSMTGFPIGQIRLRTMVYLTAINSSAIPTAKFRQCVRRILRQTQRLCPMAEERPAQRKALRPKVRKPQKVTKAQKRIKRRAYLILSA